MPTLISDMVLLRGLHRLPAELVYQVVGNFVDLDKHARDFPEHVVNLELSGCGLPTNWAIQGDSGFGPLCEFSHDTRAFMVMHILNSNTWYFDNSTSLMGFFGSIKTQYGQAMLNQVRKINYAINFLDGDSCNGVEDLAEMLSQHTRSLEVEGNEHSAMVIPGGGRPSLPNVKILKIDFKVNTFYGDEMVDVHADVKPSAPAFTKLCSKLEQICVALPIVTGLSSNELALRICQKMSG